MNLKCTLIRFKQFHNQNVIIIETARVFKIRNFHITKGNLLLRYGGNK